jgi:hypothetical protein
MTQKHALCTDFWGGDGLEPATAWTATSSSG